MDQENPYSAPQDQRAEPSRDDFDMWLETDTQNGPIGLKFNEDEIRIYVGKMKKSYAVVKSRHFKQMEIASGGDFGVLALRKADCPALRISGAAYRRICDWRGPSTEAWIAYELRTRLSLGLVFAGLFGLIGYIQTEPFYSIMYLSLSGMLVLCWVIARIKPAPWVFVGDALFFFGLAFISGYEIYMEGADAFNIIFGIFCFLLSMNLVRRYQFHMQNLPQDRRLEDE